MQPKQDRIEAVSRAVQAPLTTVLTLVLVTSSVVLAHWEESLSTQFPGDSFSPGSDFQKLPPSYDVHISATDMNLFKGTASSAGPDYWRRHGFTLRSVIAEVYVIEPSHIDLPSSLDGGKLRPYSAAGRRRGNNTSSGPARH